MDCYFQIGFGLFPDFFDKLEIVSEIYPGSIPDILKTYSKHGQNISQICRNICQQMSRTYPTCLPDISKTCPKIDFWKNLFWEKSILGKSIYIYIYINILYIFCTYSMQRIAYVVERDAAAGQPSHPAIQELGPGAPFIGGPGPRLLSNLLS